MCSLRVKCLILMCFLSGVSVSAYAEVLKCTLSSGEVVYQSQPCPGATLSEKEIKIEPESPAQQAAALADLKKVEAESQALDKEAEIQAEKDRREAAAQARQYAKQNRQQARNSNGRTRQPYYRPRLPRLNSRRGATQTVPVPATSNSNNTYKIP